MNAAGLDELLQSASAAELREKELETSLNILEKRLDLKTEEEKSIKEKVKIAQNERNTTKKTVEELKKKLATLSDILTRQQDNKTDLESICDVSRRKHEELERANETEISSFNDSCEKSVMIFAKNIHLIEDSVSYICSRAT